MSTINSYSAVREKGLPLPLPPLLHLWSFMFTTLPLLSANSMEPPPDAWKLSLPA
ncbi:hypothetical protein CHLRE_12g539121v5 [Chlamydomonas reinhardtii]|uniref:Uncharacterized protein n=1 Tax=Chlamydomonas reinhardtii TaxID=3055 RepID=A0A2K3D5D1_CHLRE|nr:uncharacterized protein CHLRE_12g539121v5 [Chlamydomonas reinhardtii]PNW75740.1 hypothetical protein CHLRE_12g539121v5 [Chlamydomonas reinhardtii]